MIVVEGVQLVVDGYIVGFGTVLGIVGGMYRHLVAISVCLMTGFKRASREVVKGRGSVVATSLVSTWHRVRHKRFEFVWFPGGREWGEGEG